MSGVTSYLDASAALAGMERAALALAQPTPLLRQIGLVLRQTTQDRFNAGTDPEGNPWHPLLPRLCGDQAGGRAILVGSGMSGGLQGSITFDTGPDYVAVGSNRIYAAVHQFGAVIRPVKAKALFFALMGESGTVFGVHAKQVTIPARPYLGVSEADQVEIAELAGLYISRLLRSG